MVNKYLALGTGADYAEITPATSSSGVGSAGQLVALNASGLIDTTMLPGYDAVTMTASEAISAGALINIWSNAGVLAVRNADNSSATKRAHGYVNSAISSSASGTVNIGNGLNTGVTGLTIGTQYFLSTVGATTATQPSAGSVVQNVGFATSATALQVQLGPTTQR